jgi:hypothetical protein
MLIWTIISCCDKWNITVATKMFNGINNRLRSIKHIQNNSFGGVNVIMIGDFYQTPLWKIVGFFKISKIMLMH